MLALLCYVFIILSSCGFEEVPLPKILRACLEDFHLKTDISRSVPERMFKVCLNQYIMYSDDISWTWLNKSSSTENEGALRRTDDNISSETSGARDIQSPSDPDLSSQFRPDSSLQVSNKKPSKLPCLDMNRGPDSGFRVRREYRTLSDTERKAYHDAVLELKRRGLYNELAKLHQGPALKEFHNGPNFLGWHRIYLILYEEALRQIDGSVSLPYWDYTLDYELDNPTESIVWTSEFMGNGNGIVNKGPFAGWSAFDHPLIRNVGAKKLLMSKENIGYILSRNKTSDITQPGAMEMFNLEMYHNDVHDWVGGDMEDLNLAPYDPVFFMHHAFVDYIWEQFRNKQYSRGINASLDFPVTSIATQAPDHEMHGFEQLKSIDGYSDTWTDKWYAYEPQPSCSLDRPSCGSPYLDCINGRCVTKTKFIEDLFPGNKAASRIINTKIKSHPSILYFENISQDERTPKNHSSSGKWSVLPYPYQNTFFLNGVSDTNDWVFIPVQVTHIRSKRYPYHSFPIRQGQPSVEEDIYSTSSMPFTELFTAEQNSQTYARCEEDPSGVGLIYVETYGLNYLGGYTETAVLDFRLTVSSAVTYAGVRKPNVQATEVVISAHDRCGRMCRLRCRIPGSIPPSYRPCSGAIRLTNTSLSMYFASIFNAAITSWFTSTGAPFDNLIALSFVCDQQVNWPWSV